jgi:hypothetical protein
MRDPPDEIPDGVELADITPKVYEVISDKKRM